MTSINVTKNCYWEDKDTETVYTATAKDSKTGRIIGRVTVSAAPNSIPDISTTQGRDLKSEIESIANDALDKLINKNSPLL